MRVRLYVYGSEQEISAATLCVRILFINLFLVHAVLRYIFIYERPFTAEKSYTLLVELPGTSTVLANIECNHNRSLSLSLLLYLSVSLRAL